MENEMKIVTSTAENITISRAEYEAQKRQLTELQLQNKWLLEQLGLVKKKVYGSSSEKLKEELMEQFSFTFNEAEVYASNPEPAEEEKVEVKGHVRTKKASGSVKDIIPDGTPEEVVDHALSEEERICAACGSRMEEIGTETRYSLVMEPPKFWVRADVYHNYACKNCEKETGEANILKTPKEPVLYPGSYASAEAVSHIVTQKFVMFSPLYRLEKEFERQGLKLSRQTMANWILYVSDTWLRPIYDVLHRNLCKEPVLHGDETTLQVLHEPGKSSTSKSYMWLYRTSGCTENPIVLYEYQPNRKAVHAEEFLKEFTGWLHADGYQGYHTLPDQIRVVGCWAHARRKFDDALETLSKEDRKESLAAAGLLHCSKLYQLENSFAELTSEERYIKRLEQEKPVLDAMLAWANANIGKTAPKSALGKALHYLLEQWPYLIRYLEDGRLEIDNNRAERSIKPFVNGRKNFLFANTPAGAQSSAVAYSMVETAKENHLDPYRYLLWVLKTAPGLSKSDENWAEKLLPSMAPQECHVPEE